ncbi:sorbosone dehydrogenase family protein [Neolewinella aurantiaca]|uniref:Sorbosone dehydrogenase family protein n=1 Tax=Neolewinella aurantiaca TaxID=2602767 RepID=A0A5C7FIQ9_9BACT|nr:sorbosone dehydrogenase family protein [Neolewinella aurantiaca]TXF86019.1 sorbosone dehydrogenase family protein [Neolewinella aurantiaca]
MKNIIYLLLLSLSFACAEKVSSERKEQLASRSSDIVQTAIGPLELPSPYSTESAVKRSEIVDWPAGQTPVAPAGFRVERWADKLQHPRSTYVGENGDVFVVESNTRNSANRIILLKTDNGRVLSRHIFAEALNQPFGMLILDGYFYVANTDATWRYPYKAGQMKLDTSAGEKILATPPRGYNNHWTRNLLASKNGDKIYVSVGSGSNVGENGLEAEKNRAAILEINPDGSAMRQFATGIRNPVGMDWNPVTGELWAAVNERDKLGDNLVPDYMTSVKEGGFYGWPFSYYGQLQDPRWAEDPHSDLVAKAIMPDVPLGPHTASLGLAFYTADEFPAKYQNGAFIGQHGSWNRAKFSGYKVVFVPFDEQGKPQPPQDFLTGFIADAEAGEVWGRPVGVTVGPAGGLLVCDDDAGIVWRVSAE